MEIPKDYDVWLYQLNFLLKLKIIFPDHNDEIIKYLQERMGTKENVDKWRNNISTDSQKIINAVRFYLLSADRIEFTDSGIEPHFDIKEIPDVDISKIPKKIEY